MYRPVIQDFCLETAKATFSFSSGFTLLPKKMLNRTVVSFSPDIHIDFDLQSIIHIFMPFLSLLVLFHEFSTLNPKIYF